jgi:superfamily II DNA or RNA helicase
MLLASQSWADLRVFLATASEAIKGDVFEALVQAYLRIDSKYDFKNVWSTHGEIPKDVVAKLNLFHRDVTGIDLVAETSEGKFWAVQAKYHQDEKWSLSRKEATGLIAGRNRAHGEFELGLICTTANGRSANLKGEPGLEYLMGDVWRSLDGAFFERLHAHLRGLAPPPPEVKTPRPHQREALEGITAYFADHSRGKVVMPCATGKSLIGFWSAEKFGARRVLVAVPNLSLVRQLLKDWTEQSVAHGRKPKWIVVCSDDSVTDIASARDLGVKVDTDPAAVAVWLREHQGAELSVVFTTYQSGRVLSEAAKRAGVKFDLGIFDEAHRTAGRDGATFAYLLSDDNVTVERRVFMTATPRIYQGTDRDDVISMDDPARYGGDAFSMTFMAAIERGIIPNLTIVVVAVAEAEIERLLRDRRFIRLKAKHEDEVIRTEDLVSALALRKAMQKYGIRRTLGFHASKRRCRLAGDIQELIGRLLPKYGSLDVFHVDGDMTSGERDSELRAFEASERALLTNVRVFVEGVDCPSMDAVIFADPKQSVIDIVQGVGRALRPFKGKEAGYAIIPTVVEADGSPSNKTYSEVVRVTSALGSTNRVITDYFAAIAKDEPWTGPGVFEVLGDVEVGIKIDLEQVNKAVSVRTYQRTVEWMSFLEARRWVHRLRLTSYSAWRAFAATPARPVDIPSDPYSIYADQGWRGWGDWIGTGRIADQYREYRPFEAARAFARALGLRNGEEWKAYARSGQKPEDIPANPDRTYLESGWNGWGDWLGTGWIAVQLREYRPFEEARAFARSLGLKKAVEWYAYAKSRAKPADIPASPEGAYRDSGYRGMGDWLGTGFIPSYQRKYRSFEAARAFARSLGLRSQAQWSAFAKSGFKPDDIPTAPSRVYRDLGWISMGDWIGTGRVADQLKVYRPFEEARAFARSLGLKNQKEWRQFAKTNKKPDDIPAFVEDTYRDSGWSGWGHWLGTGYIAPRLREYRPFDQARDFVRSLGLTCQREWFEYSRSGKKPHDIPTTPDRKYVESGWSGWSDWLAIEVTPPNMRVHLPFAEARAFARSLGLKSGAEWRTYSKSGKKPDDLPATPETIYRRKGWSGWGDWLGTGYIAHALRRHRPFAEARAFVRSLGLKNVSEWKSFARSVKKPHDIPNHPERIYRTDGWAGFGDWLGTGYIAPALRKFRRFNEARAYGRSLGLGSEAEWRAFAKSERKPTDIPSGPDDVYADTGWRGWGDWLGTGRIADQLKEYRSFEEARAFARSLGLKNQEGWREFVKSGGKPNDVPANPAMVYRETGWIGLGDWLGTGFISPRHRRFRSFNDARAHVRSLGLNSEAEWRAFAKSGSRPDDIPASPMKTYRDKGWIGLGDWLGTGKVSNAKRTYRPFEEARAFARSLGLRSQTDWRAFAKTGKRPLDVPFKPEQTYAECGWVSFGDWLGTGVVSVRGRKYRPFEEARAFVRSMRLKSTNEWYKYAASGKKPSDIPSAPNLKYRSDGWAGMGDWLGTGNKRPAWKKRRADWKKRTRLR